MFTSKNGNELVLFYVFFSGDSPFSIPIFIISSIIPFISNDLINTLLKINIRAHNHLDDVVHGKLWFFNIEKMLKLGLGKRSKKNMRLVIYHSAKVKLQLFC